MSNDDIINVTQYIKYYIDNYSMTENARINLFEELCFTRMVWKHLCRNQKRKNEKEYISKFLYTFK